MNNSQIPIYTFGKIIPQMQRNDNLPNYDLQIEKPNLNSAASIHNSLRAYSRG